MRQSAGQLLSIAIACGGGGGRQSPSSVITQDPHCDVGLVAVLLEEQPLEYLRALEPVLRQGRAPSAK